MNDPKLILEVQMQFIDKCTRLKTTKEYILNFIENRK